ncbi:MAG: DUF4258 domain-containing protein [Nitrospirae bacterium]|nr:DUF4258 domain-containing protein [Nitrospirota bacterium]
MVDIKHSDHLLLKIDILKAHGIDLSLEKVDDIIRFPDKIGTGYKNRLIAQKRLDDEHVLRVVYEEQADRILAITVYPGRRSRYEKD